MRALRPSPNCQLSSSGSSISLLGRLAWRCLALPTRGDGTHGATGRGFEAGGGADGRWAALDWASCQALLHCGGGRIIARCHALGVGLGGALELVREGESA